MTKEIVFPDLARGVAACYGHFIRTSFLLHSTRNAIIGISINDKMLFSTVGNSTVLISDIYQGILLSNYTISDEAFSTYKVPDSPLSLFTYVFEGTQLKLSNFAAIFSVPEDKVLAEFTDSTHITVKLLMQNITAVTSQDLNDVTITESSIPGVFIPAPAHNRQLAKVWYTFEPVGDKECLTIHFSGTETEYKMLQACVQKSILAIFDKFGK